MLKIILLLLTLSCTFSCGRTNAIDPATPQVVGTASEQSSTPTTSNKLAVGLVEFFAPWKASYIKLERWKDTSDPKIPHPEVFDVLCHIENKGDSTIQEGDFIILTTIDFIIAPTYLYSGDVQKIIQDHNWGRVGSVDDVKMEKVPYLNPGDRAQIGIKSFNLGKALKQFDGDGDTLWPWALRMNVHVMNRDMTRVAVGQAILPMIPSDRRLSAK